MRSRELRGRRVRLFVEPMKRKKIAKKTDKKPIAKTVLHYESDTKTIVRDQIMKDHMQGFPKAKMVLLDAGGTQSAMAHWKKTFDKLPPLILVNNDTEQCKSLKHIATKGVKVVEDDFFKTVCKMKSIGTVWYDGTSVHKKIALLVDHISKVRERIIPGGRLIVTISFRGVPVQTHFYNVAIALERCTGKIWEAQLYQTNKDKCIKAQKWMASFATRV